MYSILVIDDDNIVRAALSKILVSENYNLDFAVDVTSGFKVCLQTKPDLVLLDVHLPDGNGIDLCRRIKADPKLRHIPVFMLTGEAVGVDNRVDGLEAGADDYILKPFDPAELVLRIKRIFKETPKEYRQ